MSTLPAAIPGGAARVWREAIVAQYDEALGHLPELETPVARPGVSSAWHIYLLRLQPERLKIDREVFIEALRARNIGRTTARAMRVNAKKLTCMACSALLWSTIAASVSSSIVVG